MLMREEMDPLFNQFFGRGGDAEEATWGQGIWASPVDIYEIDETFVLKAELPGFTTEDVDIKIQGNQLILRGEGKRETEVKEEQYHRIERAYGRFERAFWLPTTVDTEKSQATFKDGVLELRLLKSEEAKPKRIAFAEAEGAAAGR
jgi:HSP20 family protein